MPVSFIFFQFEIDVKYLHPYVSSFDSLPTDFVNAVITESIKANTGKKNEIIFGLVRNHSDAGIDKICIFYFLMFPPILIEISSVERNSFVDCFGCVISHLFCQKRQPTKTHNQIRNFIQFRSVLRGKMNVLRLNVPTHTHRAELF